MTGTVVISILKGSFDDVIHTVIVPDYFSGGVFMPIPKSPTVLDNYHGITVTNQLGKCLKNFYYYDYRNLLRGTVLNYNLGLQKA